MPPRNGAAPLAVLPPGRRRFNAVPKIITFEVETLRDGKPTAIEVTGYHKDACPVWVEVQTAQAWAEWREASIVPNTEGKQVFDPVTKQMAVPETIRVESDEAEARLRRDMLLAVTRGLEEHDADILARDGGGWLEMLRALGWFNAAGDEEATPNPEAAGEAATAPTGAASSPSSRRRTARTTG